MRCPRDGAPLRRYVLPGRGAGWGCAACGSAAATMPTLRARLGEAFGTRLWTEVRAGGAATTLRCPTCVQRMRRVVVELPDDPDLHGAPDSRLELDVCRHCALVWFDPGEYEAARRELTPPPPPEAAAPPESPSLVAARQRLAIAEVEEWGRRAAEEEPHGLRALPAMLGMPLELRGHRLAGTPWLTWLVAGLVALVSVQAWLDEDVLAAMWLVPGEVWSRPWTLLTAFLVHSDVWHLIGNLWFLVVFGDNLELRYGRVRWLALLAAATLCGALMHVAFDPRSDRPCVGASGGISGLIVCYALTLPHARLGLYFWGNTFRWHHHHIQLVWLTFSARTGAAFWFVLQLLLLLPQLDGESSSSALAHLGGVLVGVLAWALWYESPVSSPARATSRARRAAR